MGSWSINEVITFDLIVDPGLFMTTLFAEPWPVSHDRRQRHICNQPGMVRLTSVAAMNAPKPDSAGYRSMMFAMKKSPACPQAAQILSSTRSCMVRTYSRPHERDFTAWLDGTPVPICSVPSMRALCSATMSHIEKLRAAGGYIDTARLTGGGSRSPVWSQMFADTIEVPMEVSDGNEIGAGAAISAGIGAGIYSNYAEATQEAVSVVHVHEPDPANRLVLPGAL